MYISFLEAREMLEQELQTAYETVNHLKQELADSQEKISLKLILEAEREKHIKALQEKAVQFEKVLKKHEERPQTSTAGTNTEETPDETELLKIKYEAELAEKEIQIREALKREYDAKILHLRQEIEATNRNNVAESNLCNECEFLKAKLNQYEIMLTDQSKEVQNLKDQLTQDHDVVAEILDDYKEKFLSLERQNQQLTLRYTETKNHYDRLITDLKRRDEDEAKRYCMIKKETEHAVKLWRRKTREEIHNFALRQQSNINEAQNRIVQVSRKTEREVYLIITSYF